MADFDIAYAYECLARAYAFCDELKQAASYYRVAQRAGEDIRDEEDRSIFRGDFQAGDWFGLPQ